MKIKSRLKKNTEVFHTICMQNNTGTQNPGQKFILIFQEKEERSITMIHGGSL
jgi:hypothetical protein